jgi:hypothetical protein
MMSALISRAQTGSGIGGKIRIGSAGGEDYDAALFQMTDGAVRI